MRKFTKPTWFAIGWLGLMMFFALFGWLLPAGLTIWSIGYGVYASHKGTSAVETMGWFRDVVLCAGDCHKHDKHHRNPSDVSNEGLITYTISALRNI